MNRRHVRTGCLTLPSMEMDGPHFYVFQALIVLVINHDNTVCPCRLFNRNVSAFKGGELTQTLFSMEMDGGISISFKAS